MARRLRSGYTTGACAAAAAKAAAILALKGTTPKEVELTFPDGSLHRFVVSRTETMEEMVKATVIKDAGDDPDVTNGAEICATVGPVGESNNSSNTLRIDNILLSGGEGIGKVTKPGLAVKVGEPAINPVPRQMICQAVQQVEKNMVLKVEISIPKGEELAEKTLNKRLGIVGGLSVLGTTGIVRPISAEAWTATIEASMNVAKEAGLTDIVLSTGRTSEKGAQTMLNLPVEAFAMMGDYLEFSLKKASEIGFSTIHLAGMWAKVMKAAMHIPQTHVRNGALEMVDGAALLETCGADGQLLKSLQNCNTAREMYFHLSEAKRDDIISAICLKARDYGKLVSGKEVKLYLIDAKARVVQHV